MVADTLRVLKTVAPAARRLGERLERRRAWLLCGFSGLYFGAALLLAARKPLWYDEIFGLHLARLPSLADLWAALRTGADPLPPLFYLVLRADHAVLGDGRLAIRVPEILAVWAMSVCVFWFVTRRSTVVAGCVAMLFPLCTHAYDYAAEARPYGLVLAFSSLALVGWQAGEGNQRPLPRLVTAASLAAAISSHYYAVLVFLPLALGELVRSWERRRVDFLMWAAFALAFVPLAFWWPLIQGARTYAPTFWAKPHWSSMWAFYDSLLGPSLFVAVGTLLLTAFGACSRSAEPPDSGRGARRARPPASEVAVALGMLALPLAAVALAETATGVFANRYALPAVIGLGIVVGWAAGAWSAHRAVVGVAVALVLGSIFVAKDVRKVWHVAADARRQAATFRFLQREAGEDLPIVISQPQVFLQFAHDAPRPLGARLIYLADRDASLRRFGSDSVDRELLELRRWAPVNVGEYRAYVTAQPRFFVYAPKGRTRQWLVPALLAEGRRAVIEAEDGAGVLILVPGGGPLPPLR